MAEYGAVLLEITPRLVDSWQNLADFFDVPQEDRARFERGREPANIIDWLRARGELHVLRDALESIDRQDLCDLAQKLVLADQRKEKPGPGSPKSVPNSDGEGPSISPSAVFCSQCWLQTPGKDKAGAPKLWCFSLGDDGELSRTQKEDAHHGSVLRKTEGASGSVTLSPDGSLIAFLAGGRLQLLGVDTRQGMTYELPYQPDLRDISQSARVLAVTRSGSREVSLAVQNGSGAMLLRVSKKGTTRLPIGISGYKTMSAAYLGQDLLYVQSLVSGEGRTAARYLLRQLRKAGCDAEEVYSPVFTPPPGFADWNTLQVFAVDVVMMGGKPFVALLVAQSGNRTECQTDERRLLVASVGHNPGEWTWRQHGVEATACSVNVVRNPYGQGGSPCVRFGTALRSDSMQQL